MPLFMTLAGEFGYGRSLTTSFNGIDLGAFSNWHSNNASTILNATIPNAHYYDYDGSPSTIVDGGYNMWNIGNFISISSFQTATNIPYGTLNNGGYFVSQPSVWPQVAFSYTKDGRISWSNAGNVGTAGSINASNANSVGSYTTSNQGRRGTYWVNQNYGTANPTICYIWFTVEQENINSILGSSNDSRKTQNPPASFYQQSVSIRGNNIMFGQILLSAFNPDVFPNGDLIPDSNINMFITNYVQNAAINIF